MVFELLYIHMKELIPENSKVVCGHQKLKGNANYFVTHFWVQSKDKKRPFQAILLKISK